MRCEMCGKETNELFLIEIEGAMLKVCKSCARLGKEVKIREKTPFIPISPSGGVKIKKRQPKDIYERMTKEVVEDYPTLVRQARVKLGLSQEDLAKKINEKRSTIANVESGHLYPSDKLVKKLEKALQIELFEEVS